jgi:p-hydroxybenzoate 3-monooxygenase
MTTMLHTDPTDDGYGRQLQRSQLRYVTGSTAAATSLAENYVGLPLPQTALLAGVEVDG